MSDKLLRKMQAAYDKISKEAVAGVYGQRYVPDKEDDDNPDSRPDVPYIDDPKGYTTHVPLEHDGLTEAEGEEPTMPKDAGAEAGADIEAPTSPDADSMPPEGDMGGEGGIGGVGMDAAGNMPGMPGQEEKLTSSEIGRVYELKKIYSRLISVETFLSRTTNEEMLEVRKQVGQSVDLFEIVISNFPQYKENVDEIIITFYEFLDTVYGSLQKHFQEMSKEQNNDRS